MRKISEILQDKRIEKGHSIEDIVRAIKVRKEYLMAIEDGNYRSLPSESNALGFVKNYAQFLGIDKNKAAALFRREYEGGQKNLPTFKSQDKRLIRKAIFTPRNFVIFAIFIIIVGYVAFQYSSFIFGPPLHIDTPKENSIIKNNIVDVSGKTDPYATILINNEEAYVGLDGSFTKTLYLFSGDNKIKIVAKNRNGKGSEKIIDVTVQ